MLLLATGSEVAIALDAWELLESEGTPARVVSMPCLEWFLEQPLSYRDFVLPPGIRARVSVEAVLAIGWRSFVGDAGQCVSIEMYGASADPVTLFNRFGFTAERVAAAARISMMSVHD